MRGIKLCKVMIFSENKKLLMLVGMANHNLGGKSEKMSWKKPTISENANFVATCEYWIDI